MSRTDSAPKIVTAEADDVLTGFSAGFVSYALATQQLLGLGFEEPDAVRMLFDAVTVPGGEA